MGAFPRWLGAAARLSVPWLWTAAAVVAQAPPSELYELSFHVEAEIRSRRLDAELLAGGRLLMASRRSPDGALTLTLKSVVEAPWKLYHVDPAGPFGEETKLAAVMDLPEASWEALAEGRETIARSATQRHARWTAASPRPARLDGAFAFVVIGPAAGRFTLATGPSGRVLEVVNQLTDNWLTGPFDRFIGGWGGPQLVGGPPLGYWFWNNGESEPFSYEPHTYHALVAAAELLDLPVPAEGSAEDWTEAGAAARGVVETLAPRTAGLFAERPCSEAAATREVDAEGRIAIESSALTEGCSAARQTVLCAGGRGVESDSIQVSLGEGPQRLLVRIGYRPVAGDG